MRVDSYAHALYERTKVLGHICRLMNKDPRSGGEILNNYI